MWISIETCLFICRQVFLWIQTFGNETGQCERRTKGCLYPGRCTLADVDHGTQKYGLATPTGTVSETGIAGLALGGGIGYLRAKHGLSCDNMVAANLVTAEGEQIRVSEKNYEDLFWAIRGNFGIITII